MCGLPSSSASVATSRARHMCGLPTPSASAVSSLDQACETLGIETYEAGSRARTSTRTTVAVSTAVSTDRGAAAAYRRSRA
eukprot:7669266-Alexandrium_andersonii.AAC.1